MYLYLLHTITRSSPLVAAVCLMLSHPLAGQSPHDGLELAESAVDGVDYLVYDRYGNRTSLLGVLGAAVESDVLLVGEEHDDMIGHAFETSVLGAAFTEFGGMAERPGRTIVLSLEMFERDVQYIVDEYLQGAISEDHFLSSSRPWDDYDVRYRPLVEFAKAHGSPVVAANAPRRYVNRVTRSGPESLESLSDLAKSYLPPLPYPGPSDRYQAQWDALMAEAMEEMRREMEADSSTSEDVTVDREVPEAVEPPEEPAAAEGEAEGPDHSMSSGAIHSQALWDAAMGHAITTALVEHLGAFVVHFAGSFHVASGTGIPERIEDYRPGTRVTTVVMTKVDDIEAWSADEHAELADFVVLTKKPEEAPATEGE